MDPRLLDLLVCPQSGAPLTFHAPTGELWCRASGLAYPVLDGEAVLLAEDARELTDAELDGDGGSLAGSPGAAGPASDA